MFAFAPLTQTFTKTINKWFPKLEDKLEEIGYTEFDIVTDGAVYETSGKIAWLREIEIPIPGLDSVSIALLADDGMTQVAFTHSHTPHFELRLIDLGAALRIKTNLLHRVRKTADDKWIPDLDAKGAPKPVEISLTAGDLIVTDDWEIEFASAPAISLAPIELGTTGIVLEVTDLELHLSGKLPPPTGAQPGFKGVAIKNAELHFTGPMQIDALPDDVVFTDLLIGSSGFSGRVEATWTSEAEAAAGNGTLSGLPFTLQSLMVEFQQNVPVDSSVRGELVLPFFDAPVNVEIGYGVEGGFHVRLDSATADGFYNISKPGIADMELDSLGLAIDDGVVTVQLSGSLTPSFGGLKWPTFDVKDLTIDSTGRVNLPGGWLSLPEQKTFDFHGFKIEISQLGFGRNDDGSKWIGFSGGLKLVEGLQAGASVEGLRITWFEGGTPKISLNGAGVELKIPGVLELKGSVSYKEINTTEGLVRRFDGDITLKLETPEITIDGMLVIGSVRGPQGRYNFFAIYVDVELPTGIPLASTGLGIYGFAGLFALQMEPNRRPDEKWFSIKKEESFYHRPAIGITDLKKKWDPRKGSFAIGAGLTLATLSDNGYTFSGKFLLAIVLPGPMIFLHGAANFLKKRSDGASEGQFRALAVYDGRAGSVLIGLDAAYKTGTGGELIEIGGSMEAFYAFNDPSLFHLYLGINEPRSLRLRALFGRFVEANAYFMLDAHALALGAWFGYNNGWNFGPLAIRLEAWADGNARLSFKPAHFHGDLWIHCLVELSAFGIGLGLALDARIAADLFKPFHLRGEFSVGIKLPWPFKKKIGATVVLEWGPRKIAPPLPLPVAQIAAEHLKSSVVWPLQRGKHLLPVWDDGSGFIAGPDGAEAPSDLATVPLVPLDARLSVTFGRSVHDAAAIGVNLQPVVPALEEIGHPGGGAVAKAKYVLDSVELSRWDSGGWQPVAKSPQTGSLPALFGSWMVLPQLPDQGAKPPHRAQTKLMVWSSSAFDFTRGTGAAWEEWVTDALPSYPCVPLLPAVETCYDFAELAPDTTVKSPWTQSGPPPLTLEWGFGPAKVEMREIIAEGRAFPVHSLCFPSRAVASGIHVRSEGKVRSFRFHLAPQVLREATFSSGTSTRTVCVDVRGHKAGTVANPWTEERVRFTVRGADGALLPQARRERWHHGPLGLNAGFRLDIELPCAALWAELIVTHRPPFRIVAFNGAGMAVATHAPTGTGAEVTETIRLEGPDITRLEVYAAGNEKLVHSICYSCPEVVGPYATGYDADGNPHGPYLPVDGVIVVPGPVTGAVVQGGEHLCFDAVCVTPDPDADQVMGREEMIEHIRTQLARWQSEGPLLRPDSAYRLTVRTSVHATPLVNGMTFPGPFSPVEHAYFRTEGPPGLTKLLPPEGVPAASFDSGLDDLVRYVRETDPPTVPAPEEKPILYRPFYRAYDLGVEFNESYVAQMYRMDGRDLGLYIYDNNNEPVLKLVSAWGATETLTLSSKDTRWVTLLNSATCLTEKLEPETFPHDETLTSSAAPHLLAPDTLHEARLVPLLLHETFAAATAGGVPPGWFAEDTGANGPSRWQTGDAGEPPVRFVEQVSPIGGTTLLFAGGASWTDYRVTVPVRSTVRGTIGVVVRRQGPGTGYRFSMDDAQRHLERLDSGATTLLREDHFGYQLDRDYLLTIEVLGGSIRTTVDGEPVFEHLDDVYADGTFGLSIAAAPGARFGDVVVDDLRPSAPVVYRFQFTTSLYANFFHHLHSFQDELWDADLSGKDVDALLGEAAALPTFDLPSEEEARAYEELATHVLGAAARQNAERVEITRVKRDGHPTIFLLRSPEPIEPARTVLALHGAARMLPPASPPDELKLTDVSFGDEESVTVLLREAVDLTGERIEVRQLPHALAEPAGDPLLWIDAFTDAGSLDRFTIVDASGIGPSRWAWERGAIVELSGTGGGNEPELPGTHAVTGEGEWTDYRITADLRGDAGGELGLLFRYRDENNYYRLSLGATLAYRRLVKCVDGAMTILWEDAKRSRAGEPFRLSVVAVGDRLTAFSGDTKLFDVRDAAHGNGRIGVYASANRGARCESLEVRLPSLEARAWLTDHFDRNDLDAWSMRSETPEVPIVDVAQWSTSSEALRLSSLTAEGVYALAGDPAWTDIILQARLRSAGATIGVAVRVTEAGSYRFSMDRAQGTRELVKKAGDTTTVLWKDAVAYEADRTYELTLVAAGTSLRGYLDGTLMFAVEDGDLSAGSIALYSANNPEAWFSGVRVWPVSAAFASWLLEERFADALPERWTFVDEQGNPAPGAWVVEAGSLRHVGSPAITRGEPAGDVRFTPRISFVLLSTNYAIPDGPEMTELRLTARMGIDPSGATAVVFGWRDAANHFAFWIDGAQGTRRLIHTVAGQGEVLWEDHTTVDATHEYAVTIDHWNGRLSGHVDGVELFALDREPAAGRVGVAGARDSRALRIDSAHFRELQAAAPQWISWHAFGADDLLPAGTRVRVQARPPATAAAEAGLVLRSNALPGERGRLRFSPSGVPLRVVRTDGRTGHQRTFLPDLAYAPHPLRMLRKADGTGGFLVPPPAMTGTLRLYLTYLRDRVQAGRAKSQVGDRSPEMVKIEFPAGGSDV